MSDSRVEFHGKLKKSLFDMVGFLQEWQKLSLFIGCLNSN